LRVFRLKLNYNNEGIFSVFETITEVKIFERLLGRSDIETLKWVHTKEERRIVCAGVITKIEEGKRRYLSEIGFKKYLKKMVDNGILEKKTRGVYFINKDLIMEDVSDRQSRTRYSR
jgi:hypothetical protein